MLRSITIVLLTLAALLLPRPAAAAINPCNTPDPGFGAYGEWDKDISLGKALIPERGGITARGGFDVIIHFHGGEAARKELVPVGLGILLVAIDLGNGSRVYANRFADPKAFTDLLDSLQKRVAAKRGLRRAYIRRLGISSWSAGYGAIRAVLDQPISRSVDAVVLLDSLYGSYADPDHLSLREELLEPFVQYARRAASGRGFMYQTHSAIRTPTFASTREISSWLVGQLGGKMRATQRRDRLGLSLIERYDRRNYHLRGYSGEGKRDHCAHLGILRDVVRAHLVQRWRHVPMK